MGNYGKYIFSVDCAADDRRSYEAEFEMLMQEAARLNEFMAQGRVEIERLKLETKEIRDETRALLAGMGAKL